MEISKSCIEGCLRGDNSAQRELYDQLLPYLNALCGRYLYDTSVRQDVLQESFVVIFKKMSLFNPQKGAFHSWASRIAINNCLKQNKNGGRFFQLQLDKHEESVDPKVMNQLSNEELIRFLKTMPKKYYEVFVLFVIDDFSHEEIGKTLGIKVSLSRKRLSRARVWLKTKPKTLNTLLGDYGYSID